LETSNGWNQNCTNNQNNLTFIYEVDLKYPQKLHDLHNNFLLDPEVFTPLGSKHKKLVPHLGVRRNYCILLQVIIILIIITCHKGVVQEVWLKPYIELNTKLRPQTKKEFEKDFFKLMNNAVYGQMLMELQNLVISNLLTLNVDILGLKENITGF